MSPRHALCIAALCAALLLLCHTASADEWWCGKQYRRKDGSLSAPAPHPLLFAPDPHAPLFFHANPAIDPYTWELSGRLIIDVVAKHAREAHASPSPPADGPLYVSASRTVRARDVVLIPRTRLADVRPGMPGFDSARVDFDLSQFAVYSDPAGRRYTTPSSSSPPSSFPPLVGPITHSYSDMISQNRLTVTFSAPDGRVLAVRTTVVQRLDPVHPYGGATVKVDHWTRALVRDSWEDDTLPKSPGDGASTSASIQNEAQAGKSATYVNVDCAVPVPLHVVAQGVGVGVGAGHSGGAFNGGYTGGMGGGASSGGCTRGDGYSGGASGTYGGGGGGGGGVSGGGYTGGAGHGTGAHTGGSTSNTTTSDNPPYSSSHYHHIFPFGGYTSTPFFFHQPPTELPLNLSRLRTVRGHTLVHPVPPFSDGSWTHMHSLLDAARDGGVGVVYDMRHTWRDEREVREQVTRWRGHKGVWVWYTADEPDGAHSPPSTLFSRTSLLRSLDPYRPTSLALNCARFRLPAYLPSAPIIMVDPYPVGTDPGQCTPEMYDCGCDECWSAQVGEVGGRVRMVRERVAWAESKPAGDWNGGERPQVQGQQREHEQAQEQDQEDDDWTAPGIYGGGGWARGARTVVWNVVQAFGGAEYWSRAPTAPELAAMLYLALVHGSSGTTWWLSPTHAGLETVLDEAAHVLVERIAHYVTQGQQVPFRGWDVAVVACGDGGDGQDTVGEVEIHAGTWIESPGAQTGQAQGYGQARLALTIVNAGSDTREACVVVRRTQNGQSGGEGDPVDVWATATLVNPASAPPADQRPTSPTVSVTAVGRRLGGEGVHDGFDVDQLNDVEVEVKVQTVIEGLGVRVMELEIGVGSEHHE